MQCSQLCQTTKRKFKSPKEGLFPCQHNIDGLSKESIKNAFLKAVFTTSDSLRLVLTFITMNWGQEIKSTTNKLNLFVSFIHSSTLIKEHSKFVLKF